MEALSTPQARAADPAWIARGKKAMVAADHPLASQAGLEILKAGGNAIDAACAVSFALGVVRPESTGLGGGGFFIVRLAADGRVVALDFREQAPQAATPDMYRSTKPAGNPPGEAAASRPAVPAPSSRYGHLAVGVPGLVAGRAEALRRFGTMPLSAVLAPALRLAEEGFPVDEHYVNTAATVRKVYEKYPHLRSSCPFVYETHLFGGRDITPGEVLRQSALARLLRGLAESGPDFFYSGPPAEALELEMKAHGGLITRADLAAYRVRERTPLRTRYHGCEIVTMPPPSSGGLCLIESLNILELLDSHDSADSAEGPRLASANPHYIVEAMKHAFADRARWLADPDFVTIPVDRLIGPDYARQLAGQVSPQATGSPESYGSIPSPGPTSGPADDSGTSHFCVVDAAGNCVVSTETVNTEFGSLAAVADWGLILNNQMDDFTADPTAVNAFGLTQSERNCPQPGKRPLSSMSPTIVLCGERPVLLLGGSGGPRIISSVLNVLLGVVDGGQALAGALAAPRLHHQWQPDEVYLDQPWPRRLAEILRSRGHALGQQTKVGVVQAISLTGGEVIGGCDPRKGGQPAGY